MRPRYRVVLIEVGLPDLADRVRPRIREDRPPLLRVSVMRQKWGPSAQFPGRMSTSNRTRAQARGTSPHRWMATRDAQVAVAHWRYGDWSLRRKVLRDGTGRSPLGPNRYETQSRRQSSGFVSFARLLWGHLAHAIRENERFNQCM